MRPRLWWLSLLSLALLLGALLLYQFRTRGLVATLDKAAGTVERDYAAAIGRFEPAALGSRFRVGDAVRTGHASSAALILDDGSKIALEPDTLLRFLATPPQIEGRGLELEAGSATLETGSSPLELYTNVGLARLEPGTSVAIVPRPSGLRFSVQLGLARFETKDGPLAMSAGDDIAIDIGGAVIEARRQVGAERDSSERESNDDVQAGEKATLLSTGRLEIAGGGPTYADMIAVAGTSFVVHDPSPPTAVGFLLRDVCPTGGVVEKLAAVGSRVLASARGDESANIVLAQGIHRYQVRCVGRDGVAAKASASGAITILRDSGTGVLSRVPPKTRIDTDGRNYTVMYQNLLPEIVVRWPKAPAASSYTLTLDSRSGESTTQVAEPTLTFKGGQIKEGRHTLTFSADGRSSAPTKLAIVFENAAPTARIQSPQNGSFQPGSSVNVVGVAALGWGISVAGRELAMDDQARFSDQVTASGAQQTLQLCFTHPRRGVHYYLRHAAGASL